jgi:hypothetical protein
MVKLSEALILKKTNAVVLVRPVLAPCALHA